jgi:hypothetical protein
MFPILAFIASAMYSGFDAFAIIAVIIFAVFHYLVGPVVVMLSALNLLCMTALGLLWVCQNSVKPTTYALVCKTLQLFIINSIRGAFLHRLAHGVSTYIPAAALSTYSPSQTQTALSSFRDNNWWVRPSRHGRALSQLFQAVIAGLPELCVLLKVARESKNPDESAFSLDTLHALLRDVAWSAPMFCFVLSPIVHMLATYAGGLYRRIQGTQHVDAVDREDAGSFFTYWSMACTVVFASGTFFLALFPSTNDTDSNVHSGDTESSPAPITISLWKRAVVGVTEHLAAPTSESQIRKGLFLMTSKHDRHQTGKCKY